MTKNLWTVKFNEHWTYQKEGEFWDDRKEYNVVATSYEQAVRKAEKCALKNSFMDDETGTLERVTAVRLVSINCRDKVDA